MMKRWKVMDPRGKLVLSATPGQFGGHKRSRIYGRLDCPAALRALSKGGYVNHRVFFIDEETARRAGYRPCFRCMPARYREWKLAMTVQLREANDEVGKI